MPGSTQRHDPRPAAGAAAGGAPPPFTLVLSGEEPLAVTGIAVHDDDDRTVAQLRGRDLPALDVRSGPPVHGVLIDQTAGVEVRPVTVLDVECGGATARLTLALEYPRVTVDGAGSRIHLEWARAEGADVPVPEPADGGPCPGAAGPGLAGWLRRRYDEYGAELLRPDVITAHRRILEDCERARAAGPGEAAELALRVLEHLAQPFRGEVGQG